MSDGMRLEARKDCLPLAGTLDVKTGRDATRKVAKRLEAEWGDAQPCCIAGRPTVWDRWPRPDGAFTVGLDGGAGRTWCAQKPTCEVMVGKRTRSCREDDDTKAPASIRFGFVPPLETQPHRRRDEGWHAPGLPLHQDVPLLADGHDPLRALPLERSPKAPPMLAWFYLTRPLTAWEQDGKGWVQCAVGLGAALREQSAHLQWAL